MLEPIGVQAVVDRIAARARGKLLWLNDTYPEPPESALGATFPALIITVGEVSESAEQGGWLKEFRRFNLLFLERPAVFAETNAPISGMWSHLDAVTRVFRENTFKLSGERLHGLESWKKVRDTGYRITSYPQVQDAPPFHGYEFSYIAGLLTAK